MHMHANACMHAGICMHVYANVCIRKHMHGSSFKGVHVHAYIYIYVYMYIYMKTIDFPEMFMVPARRKMGPYHRGARRAETP